MKKLLLFAVFIVFFTRSAYSDNFELNNHVIAYNFDPFYGVIYSRFEFNAGPNVFNVLDLTDSVIFKYNITMSEVGYDGDDFDLITDYIELLDLNAGDYGLDVSINNSNVKFSYYDAGGNVTDLVADHNYGNLIGKNEVIYFGLLKSDSDENGIHNVDMFTVVDVDMLVKQLSDSAIANDPLLEAHDSELSSIENGPEKAFLSARQESNFDGDYGTLAKVLGADNGYAYEPISSTPTIPEPRFYALFVGIISLGLVVFRRIKSN